MRFRTHWQTWLKVGLGLVLFLLALQAGFQPAALWAALQSLDPLWALATLGLVILSALGKALRWSWLLTGVSPTPSFRQTLGPLLTGQAFNMLAWARMGDIVRTWLLASQTNTPIPAVAATLIIENVFELCAYGSLALILSTTLATIPSATNRIPLMLAVAGVGLVALTLFVYQGERLLTAVSQRLTHWHLNRLKSWLLSAITALTPLKQRHRFWPILGLTTLIWLLAWFTNLTLFNAFRLPLPPAAGLLILVLIIVGVAPGLMPTNLGPFYFLTILALQQYKVDAPVAFAYAAVLHAMVTGVPVVGAALHLANQWRHTGARPRLTPPLSWPKP